MKLACALLSLAAISHAAQLPLGSLNVENALEYTQADTGGFAGIRHEPPQQEAKPHRNPKHRKPVETFTNFVQGNRRTFTRYPGYRAGDPDIVYELISHDAFPNYKLRLREPSICDPGVVQYSGYLDISDDKHLFFWSVIELSRIPAVCPPCIQAITLYS